VTTAHPGPGHYHYRQTSAVLGNRLAAAQHRTFRPAWPACTTGDGITDERENRWEDNTATHAVRTVDRGVMAGRN
jgi:hypothetical protein